MIDHEEANQVGFCYYIMCAFGKGSGDNLIYKTLEVLILLRSKSLGEMKNWHILCFEREQESYLFSR